MDVGNRGFALPNWIVETWLKLLKPSEVRLLNVIARYADWDTGRNAYPSYEKIQDLTGMSSSTISAAIKGLEHKRIIDVEQGGGKGRPNKYHINLKPLSPSKSMDDETLLPVEGLQVSSSNLEVGDTLRYACSNPSTESSQTLRPTEEELPLPPITTTTTSGVGDGPFANDPETQNALVNAGINRCVWENLEKTGTVTAVNVNRIANEVRSTNAKNPPGLIVKRLLNGDVGSVPSATKPPLTQDQWEQMYRAKFDGNPPADENAAHVLGISVAEFKLKLATPGGITPFELRRLHRSWMEAQRATPDETQHGLNLMAEALGHPATQNSRNDDLPRARAREEQGVSGRIGESNLSMMSNQGAQHGTN